MIYGIGVDSCSISRIKEKIQKEHFVQRVFGEEERSLFAKKGKHIAETAAGNFAAKEAFLKAVGTGLGGLHWQNCRQFAKKVVLPNICFLEKRNNLYKKKA